MSVENYDKFKNLVLKDGLNFAMHVWKELDGTSGTTKVVWRLIDGHGRLELLKKLRSEGYKIPPVPCVEIEALNLQDAKRKVLAASSSFNRTTTQGLYEFMGDAELGMLDVNEFDLPDINLDKFQAEYFSEPEDDGGDGSTELERGSFTKFSQECPKCGFSFNDKEAKGE